MSLRVYLCDDVLESPIVTRAEGDPAAVYRYQGLRIQREAGGRLHIDLPSIDDAVPPDLLPFAEEFSTHERIPTTPPRTLGLYRHSSAEGTLDQSSGAAEEYTLRIRGTTCADVQALYLAVRAGTIQPENSWGGQQEEGGPRAEAHDATSLVIPEGRLFEIDAPQPAEDASEVEIERAQNIAELLKRARLEETSAALHVLLLHALHGDRAKLSCNGYGFFLSIAEGMPALNLSGDDTLTDIEPIVARLLLCTDLDPFEEARPQHGSLALTWRHRDFEIDVDAIPVAGGLTVVISFPAHTSRA